MTAITIMLGCRMGGSDTCRLRQCLTSLIDNATDVGNFEILVKCDNDDPALDEIIHTLHQLGCRANIRCIVTPRGLGYTDLHKAYLDLLRIANPTSELYWVISDDIEMQTPGWDNKMLAAVSRHADAPFVLITKEFDHTSMRDAAERCDPYPMVEMLARAAGWVWLSSRPTGGHRCCVICCAARIHARFASMSM